MDEASAYEELLEKLTERNLDLTQKNSQLAQTVADLEASQEVIFFEKYFFHFSSTSML